ncbi:hypothetical protein JNL27_10805 [bacterium]|nr:hypothetical protein [bacterium]
MCIILDFIKTYAIILIQLCTFFFALFAYRKFASRHTISKQLEHVFELIKQVHESPFTFFVIENSPSDLSNMVKLDRSIFQIAQSKPENFDSYEILFIDNLSHSMKFMDFIAHPLTPTKIVNDLRAFVFEKKGSLNYVEASVKKRNFIILGSGVDPFTDMILSEVHSIAFKSWVDLRKYSIQLRTDLIKWLEDNNVKEINL